MDEPRNGSLRGFKPQDRRPKSEWRFRRPVARAIRNREDSSGLGFRSSFGFRVSDLIYAAQGLDKSIDPASGPFPIAVSTRGSRMPRCCLGHSFSGFLPRRLWF